LVIEDEEPMRTALVETLKAEGYRVRAAADGPDGLEVACTGVFDLVLLDVMMPGLDGFAVCRELRKRGRAMPVLMLTAKGQVDDRVDGLDSGADDYLVKPFSLKELLARVRALLRRRERDEAVGSEYPIGTAVIDFPKRLLVRGDLRHELSEKETGMLRLLATHAGETVSREKFLDVVWGYHAYPSTRTVDNFIAALRAKLEADPANPRHLITVRGAGYRLER
jgi:DNA-binding response OmpR family regulator